jgi:serine/threonine-protein kinase
VNRTDSYSDTIDADVVVSQSPAGGSMAPKGSVVTVNVSLGKEEKKVRVPNLIGLTEADGTVEAVESGLQIGSVTRVYNNEVAEGLICYQSYSNGSYVEPDTVLDIKVSQGPAKSSYKCNINIGAPTPEEAPDYVSGTEVAISLVTDDGEHLLDTRTTGFPQAANYYGLKSAGGTITMTYTVQVAGETVTDPETGESVTSPGTTQEKSFTRRVEFVEE